MASVNPITREILLKIVYYGPGLGGKTTTLQYVHKTTDSEHRGKMVSLATPVDRTLYFDFLPIRLPRIGGYTLRLQLFTVPGQVHYNATRKLVLTNADGVVFVADSQRSRLDANVESIDNLKENLIERKIDITTFPLVLQYNKRDLEDVAGIEELNALLNPRAVPWIGTCAVSGDGVYDGLEIVTKEVLRDLKRRDILARQDRPLSDQADSRLEFRKSESDLSDTVQEYSESVVASLPLDPQAFKTETPRYHHGAPDRPTIPAPAAEPVSGSIVEAFIEKMAQEPATALAPEPEAPAAASGAPLEDESDFSVIHPAVTSSPPPPTEETTSPGLPLSAESPGTSSPAPPPPEVRPEDPALGIDILEGVPERDESFQPLTFVPLWPPDAGGRGRAIENAMAARRDMDAMRGIWLELERIIAEAGGGLKGSTPEGIIGLLGLSGRHYLEIARLARMAAEGRTPPSEAVLRAYVFLLQALRASAV